MCADDPTLDVVTLWGGTMWLSRLPPVGAVGTCTFGYVPIGGVAPLRSLAEMFNDWIETPGGETFDEYMARQS